MRRNKSVREPEKTGCLNMVVCAEAVHRPQRPPDASKCKGCAARKEGGQIKPPITATFDWRPPEDGGRQIPSDHPLNDESSGSPDTPARFPARTHTPPGTPRKMILDSRL